MHSITVFLSAAFFYCIGTAVASQPDKVKLLLNEGHKKSLTAPFKTQHMEVKKGSDDPDRRLAKDGSIRGGKTEDSAKRKRQLQDWNTAFEAHVAMPIRMQSMMKKTSGDSNRRLQTPECTEQDNGLLGCVLDGYPWEGAAVVFLDCPVSATSVFECQSCGILATADDTLPQCNSCSVCSDTVAYDCTNLFQGECTSMDCNGNCNSDDTGTDPDDTGTDPDDTGTDPDETGTDPALPPASPTPNTTQVPTSSASMKKLGILAIPATAIAAFGLF